MGMIQDGKIVVLGKENFFEMSSPMRQESISFHAESPP